MFTPENELEHSLIKACSHPSHRPQFYKDFIDADIFIIQQGPLPAASGQSTLQEGRSLQIMPFEMKGKSYLPIFSSLTRLSAVIENEVGYVSMKARDFLQMTLGADVVLNPGSQYGKELLRDEIASILDGSMWKPIKHELKEASQVLLGQPARYPQALVNALSQFFATRSQVQSAYLALIHSPTSDERPHTLIGINASDDWDQIVVQVGAIAESIDIPDPPLDIVSLTGTSTFHDYFKSIQPFYMKSRKKWLGIF